MKGEHHARDRITARVLHRVDFRPVQSGPPSESSRTALPTPMASAGYAADGGRDGVPRGALRGTIIARRSANLHLPVVHHFRCTTGLTFKARLLRIAGIASRVFFCAESICTLLFISFLVLVVIGHKPLLARLYPNATTPHYGNRI